jgi:chromosome segregation ATPase
VTATTERNSTVSLGSASSGNRSTWVHFLFSGFVLLLSIVFYQSSQAETLRRQLMQIQHDNLALKSSLTKSDHSLQEALADFHRELHQFHEELASASAETDEAQEAAVRRADALIGRLEKKHSQQEEMQRQLRAELNKVKQSTAETSTQLSGISNVVGSVKSEVELVRSDARQANSGLRETRGDLGNISGMIATNAAEIQTLRERGDRNVYEFTLEKSGGMQRVGDVQIELDKTDAKRNRFTVEIQAADQRVERRDRAINEPVQFYVPGKGGLAYELVVNEVGKNSVKGYLAAPKVTMARNSAANRE